MDVELAGLPPHVHLGSPQEVPAALAALGISGDRPVLVSVGGAGGMGDDELSRVEDVVRERLVPVIERRGAAVVDGGTDAGVMRMFGGARQARGGRFPLIGVAAAGTVRLPGRAAGNPDAAELESRHSGVLVVPGSDWGAESPWIADVAGRLAGALPSVTLVINGGRITIDDIEHSLAARRPVVVVSGTGRAADAIADAVAGRCPAQDPRLARIAASPLVSVLALHDPGSLAAAVEAALG